MKTVNRTQVKILDLKPHPKNYRSHPDDQLEHIKASIKQNGIYRNVVTANDFTILAGHGVVQACKSLGIEKIEVVRLPFGPDSEQAKKVLIGDNQIAQLGIVDDRVMTEILKELAKSDPMNLVGTGFDAMMLSALAMVTRPIGEIKDENEAAQWAGMPTLGVKEKEISISIRFKSKKDQEKWTKLAEEAGMGLKYHYKAESAWTCWWPHKERDDLASVKFTDENEKPKKIQK